MCCCQGAWETGPVSVRERLTFLSRSYGPTGKTREADPGGSFLVRDEPKNHGEREQKMENRKEAGRQGNGHCI